MSVTVMSGTLTSDIEKIVFFAAYNKKDLNYVYSKYKR